MIFTAIYILLSINKELLGYITIENFTLPIQNSGEIKGWMLFPGTRICGRTGCTFRFPTRPFSFLRSSVFRVVADAMPGVPVT
jgi:hypothetical protein